MADRSICLSPACGVSVDGNVRKCPECGWAMRSPRNIRVRGWVLIGVGLFLVLLMGTVAWHVAPAMLNPGKEAGGMRFDGTPELAELALAIFALVILFGLFSIANGLYMIVNGRPNRLFAWTALAIGAILFAIGWAVRRGLV
jgi:hypothetical protein